MGWRAQDAFDGLDREDYRAWRAAQPLCRRLAIRLGQAVRLAVVLAFLAALASVLWPL